MNDGRRLRVAAVQATPVYLDRDATLDIVAESVSRAGADGADLVVFPESFVPGHPDWVWRREPTSDGEWYRRFQDQAVDLAGPALDTACSAAAAAGVWVALGVTERTSSGTLYNAVVYIDDGGGIAGVHRKLVPTGAERLLWANGQGPLLTVIDIGGVKVGSLICWEAYMPLARAALYQKGTSCSLRRGTTATMPDFPALGHVAITVKDLSVSRPWYRDLIGADTFTEFRIGFDHIAFACDDRAALEGWQTHLDDLGIDHGGIVDAHYGSGLSFRDPDGIALEFFSPSS